MDNEKIIEYFSSKDFLNFSKAVDKVLIPCENEVKNNAEFSTPFLLRQEMINKIPSIFWESPKKVFEPSCGKGGFLLDIIHKFMEGLKNIIEDVEERYRVILEECLYYSDINTNNILIIKSLIDPYNKYKLNFNEGDTLELNIQDKWNIYGFDAVIGNPPYQNITEKGISKGGGNNLYTKFVYFADKVLVQGGYLLFINPPTFFSAGRSNNKNNTNLRKDVLSKYYYHYINLQECSKYFNVGSKFIYYLIEKNNNFNENLEIDCKYKRNIYKSNINQITIANSNYIPYLLTKVCLDIINKIRSCKCNNLPILNSPDNRNDKKHILQRKRNETSENYKIRSKNNGYIFLIQSTGVQEVYSSKVCENQYKKKVLMSESGYLKPFYDDGKRGVGGHCFYCLVNDKEEGEKIIRLLNSNLYKFYIEVNKWSGFHNKAVLQDLPNILKHIDNLNNDEIYRFFGITEDEIKYIEDNI